MSVASRPRACCRSMMTVGMAVHPACISGFDHFASLTFSFSASAAFSALIVRSNRMPLPETKIRKRLDQLQTDRGGTGVMGALPVLWVSRHALCPFILITEWLYFGGHSHLPREGVQD